MQAWERAWKLKNGSKYNIVKTDPVTLYMTAPRTARHEQRQALAHVESHAIRGSAHQRLLRSIHYPATHMSLAKVAVVCALTALLISACGIQQKPLAGTPRLKSHVASTASSTTAGEAHACLRLTSSSSISTTRPSSDCPPSRSDRRRPPTIIFEPTPGAAQALQLKGKDEGAEVIGSALLFQIRRPPRS